MCCFSSFEFLWRVFEGRSIKTSQARHQTTSKCDWSKFLNICKGIAFYAPTANWSCSGPVQVFTTLYLVNWHILTVQVKMCLYKYNTTCVIVIILNILWSHVVGVRGVTQLGNFLDYGLNSIVCHGNSIIGRLLDRKVPGLRPDHGGGANLHDKPWFGCHTKPSVPRLEGRDDFIVLTSHW